MASACCSSWAGATTNWPNRRCATRPCPKPISRTCWHCASPPCAKAWSGWAVSTRARAQPAARHLPPGIHQGNRAGRKTRRLLRAAPGRRRPAPGPPVPAPVVPGPGPGRHAQAPAGAGRRTGPAAARGRPARQRLEPLLPAPRLRPDRRKRMGHRIPARAKTGANASKPCDGGFAATQCRPALRHGQSKVGREEDPTKINATTQQDRPNRGRADPAPPVRSRPLGKRALRGPLRSRQRHAALALILPPRSR